MNHFQPFHNNSNNNSLDHHHHHHLFPLQHHPTTTNQTPSAPKDRPLHDTPDEGWLRLSIGAATPDVVVHRHRPQPPGFRFGLTELDLLSPAGLGSKGHESSSVGDSSPGMVLAQPPPELNWTFRPISSHNPSSSNCSSSSLPYGPYFSTPFQLHPGLDLVAAATTAAAAAGPSSDNNIRVVDPPRSPHSGIWFSLQPWESNQGKQPALPQRSSYLRIKDGRMRVGLVMKYLVKKLRLESETEVEIWCRGEKVEGWLTMQQIRDNIWTSKHSSFTLLPHSSTIPHIMLLHYSYSYYSPVPHSSSSFLNS